jgi:hypothetical protein
MRQFSGKRDAFIERRRRSKALVTNGKIGHIQFYSLANDKHLYNVSLNDYCSFYTSIVNISKVCFLSLNDNVYRFDGYFRFD